MLEAPTRRHILNRPNRFEGGMWVYPMRYDDASIRLTVVNRAGLSDETVSEGSYGIGDAITIGDQNWRLVELPEQDAPEDPYAMPGSQADDVQAVLVLITD